MLNLISLLLIIIIFGGSIALSVHSEIQYRRELKKLGEIAKKIEEIKVL